MNAVAALGELSRLGVPYWTTAEASAVLKLTRSAASHLLARLARGGSALRLKPGLWTLPGRLERLRLAEALAAPFPAYVSLHTALHLHGMISQIPETLYAATLARARRFATPLGPVSLHHVSPDFFSGFTRERGFAVAVPEKALVDVLYLAPAKSRLFGVLPELELPRNFRPGLARRMAKSIPSPRTRSLVLRRLDGLLAAG